MPRWTNRWDLPMPIALAWQHDDYQSLQDSLREKLNAPMFSVTTLINPPQINVLYQRHRDELVLDVIGRTHSQAGKGIDAQLDRAPMPGVTFSHCRFVTGIHHPTIGPVYISFEPDLVYERKFEDKEPGFRLVDLKDTKVRAVDGGEIKAEWRWQLRMYRFLLQQGNTYQCIWDQDALCYTIREFHPIKITRTSLCARLKDWSKWEAYTKGGIHRGYPASEFIVMDCPPAPNEHKEVLSFIHDRVGVHHAARELPDDKLPECTEKDRWAKPSCYAVVYLDGKSKGRAVPKGANFHTRRAAEAFKANAEPKSKNKMNIEFRPGAQTRCEDWCDVAQVCQQFKKLRQQAAPF